MPTKLYFFLHCKSKWNEIRKAVIKRWSKAESFSILENDVYTSKTNLTFAHFFVHFAYFFIGIWNLGCRLIFCTFFCVFIKWKTLFQKWMDFDSLSMFFDSLHNWYIHDIGSTKIFLLYEIFCFWKFLFLGFFSESVKYIMRCLQDLEKVGITNLFTEKFWFYFLIKQKTKSKWNFVKKYS